ncbi:hypothetical protein ACP275_01G081500 [Erythranthe tilingii]
MSKTQILQLQLDKFSTKSFVVLFVLIFALVIMEGEMAEARNVVSAGPTSQPGNHICTYDEGECGYFLPEWKCVLKCVEEYGPDSHSECIVPIGARHTHCYCYHDCD